MGIQQRLIDLIKQADRAGANALLAGWAAEHGLERLLAEVLEPALHQIGHEWRSAETCSLAQAYVAARVVEDALTIVTAPGSSAAPVATVKGPVVIGNTEDDFHALGRRMVGIFLRSEGWAVHDLGNDVLAETFVDKAVEVGARVIGVSAMMLTTARNIRKIRAEIDRRHLTGRIQLAVGGAVFLAVPELLAEVGGDGTAPNAMAVPRLFDQLWQDACAREAGP